MKEDKVYPAFYRDTDKAIYIYLNAGNYYCYSRGMWDQTSDEDDHENDTNITREYLQNTWGVVDSKEHAEFIVELAENAGLDCDDFDCYTFDCDRAYFYTILDSLEFTSSQDLASNDGEKLITIPLPPKEVEEMKNNGDNLILGCEDSKCDEWPKVGDKVVISKDKEHPLTFDQAGFSGINLKVISKVERKGGIILTLEHNALGVIAMLHGGWIKKPKTPEEDLRDGIIELIENTADVGSSTEELVETMFNLYNITKKPQ